MNDTSPVGAGPRMEAGDGGLNSRIVPYGAAVIATALAAISWLAAPSVLAGVLTLVVAASTFGLAFQLSKAERVRETLDAALKRSTKDASRVQAFLHNVRDGVHILDTEGRLVDVSDSFCQMLGYTREEMIGMHVLQWDAVSTPEQMRTFLDELYAHPEIVTFATRHRRKDGAVIDVEIYGSPLEMNGQRVLFHSARDISDRKVLEAKYHDMYQTILSVKGERKDG